MSQANCHTSYNNVKSQALLPSDISNAWKLIFNNKAYKIDGIQSLSPTKNDTFIQFYQTYLVEQKVENFANVILKLMNENIGVTLYIFLQTYFLHATV